jgi:hypothetical protein
VTRLGWQDGSVSWETWNVSGMALVDGHWRGAMALERHVGDGTTLVRVRLSEDVALPDMQTYARELHMPPAREVVIPLTDFAADEPAAES